MAFCTRCGSSNSASARFCCHCGTAIPVVGPATPYGWQAVPATPAVPVAYVYPRRYKSVALAVLLAMFFGPLGMLYSTVPGALVMLLLSVPLGIFSGGLSMLLTWPICVIWAGIAAHDYNQGY